MEISGRFAELRKSTSLNKKQFADSLGIDQSVAGDIELGQREPSRKVMLKLAETYNVNIHWFLTGNGEMFLESKPQKEEKHPLIADLESLIDQRLEKIESRMAEIEGRITKAGLPPSNGLDSGLYTSEPEPEYGDDSVKAPLVENIAAGLPIHQWDDHSVYVDVPRRFIRTKPEDYYVARVKGTSMVAAGIPDGYQVLIRRSDTPRDGAIQVVEFQGEATLKRIREVPGNGWKICYEDYTGRVIPVGPGDEFRIQGDFVTVLLEEKPPLHASLS